MISSRSAGRTSRPAASSARSRTLAPLRLRGYVLLAESVLYILWQGEVYGLAAVLGITALTWLAGWMLARWPGRVGNIIGAVSISGLVLALFLWKLLGEAVPIGLSFYVFQAISYLADLMQGKGQTQSPGGFALYMTWFPKWMSGPIERAGHFRETVDHVKQTRWLAAGQAEQALSCLLWGLMCKLVIADRIGTAVDQVFLAPETYGGAVLALSSLLYTIQIYCDFAGYTNIMLGISALFGLELTQNFRTPYLSENITQFWRSWHISLSSFLRDYVYIPLGGNRKGTLRKALNTMLVFLACGLWHGIGWCFLIWGLLHGLYSVLTDLLRRSRAAFLTRGGIGRILTFCLVSFAWIFFRAPSPGVLLHYLQGLISPGWLTLPAMEEGLFLGLSGLEWAIAAVAICVLVLMDVLAWRRQLIPPDYVCQHWGDIPRCLFHVILALGILIFGRYGSGEEVRSFVYMNF